MATAPDVAAPAAAMSIPEVVYGAFCGEISQLTAQKVVNSLAIAMGAKVKHVHLLFQSAGGYVGDGVFLYNFFRTIPIELTLYNVGQISSIGVIAYLGAKTRKTSESATFMLHRSTNSPQFATATNLQHVVGGLALDDERTEIILRNHANFPHELWEQINHHEIYLSAKQAVQFGVANEIGQFAPPVGTQVFNILG
jgi:ATP-dependent protease ClpP protease subunit